jgi:TRAP-type C4-dicarboxylate transport system permease small subunit
MNSEARNPLPGWIGIPTNSCALFAGVLIILMMVHVSLDVFFRIALNSPLFGTLEIVAGYYMVAIVFLPLSYVSGGEGHIFIELFTSKLPPRVNAFLDAFTGGLTLLYVSLLAWQSGVEALWQTAGREKWETADDFITIWPSRWLIPIGCALMAVYFCRAIKEQLDKGLEK